MCTDTNTRRHTDRFLAQYVVIVLMMQLIYHQCRQMRSAAHLLLSNLYFFP